MCTEKQQDIKERQEKVIYLLLSRFYNPGAKIIEIMTGCYYSHTSIGLSEDMNTFYIVFFIFYFLFTSSYLIYNLVGLAYQNKKLKNK